MKRLLYTIIISLFCSPALADDNAIAWRLYEQGRFAEAAEIFTDPGWKGVALYKSEQYWRAAEAFVRGDDARSLYNLGNCYAKLGYYELALQAYLGALARDSNLADAGENAAIMRKLIGDRDDGAQAGLQPQAQKIDELESREEDEKGRSQSGDESGAAQEQRSSPDGDENRAPSDRQGQTQSDQGGAGDGAERQIDEGAAGQNNVQGRQGEQGSAENTSGGSDGDLAQSDDQAAGLRTKLEGEQATEQWLNRIRDDPAKFLKARIALEARRRLASGNSSPVGGSPW